MRSHLNIYLLGNDAPHNIILAKDIAVLSSSLLVLHLSANLLLTAWSAEYFSCNSKVLYYSTPNTKLAASELHARL